MRFGMGLVLSKEEEQMTYPIAHECYVALGLANDFFSFDEEWASFQKSDQRTLTNAVWLFMQWHNVDIATAKSMVRDTANQYEQSFVRLKEDFLRTYPRDRKLRNYLNGLAYQIIGNVAWSLTCPRYSARRRYDPNVGTDMPDRPIIAQGVNDDEIPFMFNPTKHHRTSSCASDTSSIVSSISSNTGSEVSLISSVSSRADSEAQEKLQSVELDTQRVDAPFEYISSLPSKGVRDAFIDALNVWLNVPEQTIARIKTIINTSHGASLMLDDIEDSSPLRRGKPATHKVYGVAQTMNSANYYIIIAIEEAAKLQNQHCVPIIIQALKDLHIGQSWDLRWTQSSQCPSEEEYLAMIDKKTGGLFELAAQLMQAHSTCKANIGPFLRLLGRQFQIRDDYINLVDADFAFTESFVKTWMKESSLFR